MVGCPPSVVICGRLPAQSRHFSGIMPMYVGKERKIMLITAIEVAVCGRIPAQFRHFSGIMPMYAGKEKKIMLIIAIESRHLTGTFPINLSDCVSC